MIWARLGGLWRHRDFRLYWQAATVSAFGTAVTRLALPLIATISLRASPFEIGLIAFAEEAPLLVLGIFAGVWVDRHKRLPIMLVTDLARAVLLVLVPLAWWRDWLSVPLLIGFALAVGTLSVFFEIAAQSLISTLLDPSDYVEGNSKRYAGEAAAVIAGPGLGGALTQITGPANALLVDAVSYVYSFFCLRKIAFREPQPVATKGEGMVRAVGGGLREIWRNPYLRPITLASGALTFFAGVGFAMIVPFGSRTLDLSSTTIGIGLSATGLGSLLGSFIGGRVITGLGLGRGLAFGLLADIPGLLILAAATGGNLLTDAMFIGGLFLLSLLSPIYDVNQFSLRQAVTPDQLRGRVVATTRVAIRGCAALGALAGGIAGAVLGLRGAIIIGALSPLIPFLVIWTSPVLALRTMPSQAAQTGEAIAD